MLYYFWLFLVGPVSGASMLQLHIMYKKVYLAQDDTTIESGYEDSDSDFEEKSVIDKDLAV